MAWRLGWWLGRAIVVFLVGSVLWVLIYKWVPVPITATMLMDGNSISKDWTPLTRIDRTMVDAAIAGEDSRFCTHHGFDQAAMLQAFERNQQGGRIRGGSTISQQTAKNVFLWQGGGYFRKGLEAWFTVLIEQIWGKRRIMEVYLNTIEWGPGVYGAEAAARRNFGVGADKLTPAQASRLAAILPSPLKWRADTPGRYVKKRSRRIGAASGTVRRDGLADCVLR